jgi:hypothetical protein
MVFGSRLGEMRDCMFESQVYHASGLNAVVSAVILARQCGTSHDSGHASAFEIMQQHLDESSCSDRAGLANPHGFNAV